MSDTTELSVYFRTNNKNPLQELRGIFNNSWDTILVNYKQGDNTRTFFNVRILELSLLECNRIFKEVYAHCKKNGRTIQCCVTYGAVYEVFLDELKLEEKQNEH